MPSCIFFFFSLALFLNHDMLMFVFNFVVKVGGDLKHAYKAIAMSVIDPPAFFAKRLFKSMAGVGTDDASLIRLIVTRSEVDLQEIKASYFSAHQKTLKTAIHEECSGDYKHMLYVIVKD